MIASFSLPTIKNIMAPCRASEATVGGYIPQDPKVGLRTILSRESVIEKANLGFSSEFLASKMDTKCLVKIRQELSISKDMCTRLMKPNEGSNRPQ